MSGQVPGSKLSVVAPCASAQRHGASHELAPRDAALFDLVEPIFQFGHLLPP
jgi:hypothetical protein